MEKRRWAQVESCLILRSHRRYGNSRPKHYGLCRDDPVSSCEGDSKCIQYPVDVYVLGEALSKTPLVILNPFFWLRYVPVGAMAFFQPVEVLDLIPLIAINTIHRHDALEQSDAITLTIGFLNGLTY